MPRFIVDAANVIGSRPDGWWRDRAGAARRLLADLQHLTAGSDDEVTLVLEGRRLEDVPEGAHDGVDVLYARRQGRDAGDDRIIEAVGAASDPRSVVVVTSDRALARRARALGAEVIGAGTLLARLGRSRANPRGRRTPPHR